MGKNLQIVLMVLVVGMLAVGGYLIFQNQKLIKSLPSSQQVIQPLGIESSPSAQSSSPNPSPKTLTLAEVQNAIQASVNSKNFAALIPYATRPTVNFSLMSTECCQPQTPEELVTQLKYVNDGLPLDFNQQSQTVKNLKSKNSQLANAFIGISTTGEQSAAFTIDSQNKIAGIQLSISWKLYNF